MCWAARSAARTRPRRSARAMARPRWRTGRSLRRRSSSRPSTSSMVWIAGRRSSSRPRIRSRGPTRSKYGRSTPNERPARHRYGLSRVVGPHRRRADPAYRQLGPGRGVRAGGIRRGGAEMAGRRCAAAADRVVDHGRRQPCDRPAPARGTLRSLTGLTTAEIARAFLVPEATVAKRLTRTKSKIVAAGIAYRVPPAHLLPERTAGVLAVLYLMFNEGYSASSGEELIRVGLCDDAIRLARSLRQLMPDQPEVAGALALMLLQHSRRRARLDDDGELVTLEDQDRARWDRAEIDEALQMLESALRRGAAGPYQLQATIAACHARAATAAEIDWPQIAGLYALLEAQAPSPVVRLNRAVAVAMAGDLDTGLAMVDELGTDPRMARYYLLDAARADMLRRRGDPSGAADAYRRALPLAPSEAERRFLRRRITELWLSRHECGSFSAIVGALVW